MDTVLGAASIVLDVASEAAEAFGPLETVAVRNKINNLLSRIAVLEALFRTPAGDVAEEECWNELLQYAIICCPNLVLISYQQAQGDCEPIAITEGKVNSAAVCGPCSR